MKTIFITIPSYEDAQLIETIEGAISNASHPKNIFFAIALQYKKMKAPDMGKYFRNPNFKTVYYDVDSRPGVNQVRHNLLKFYNNQDFILMIDSHSTFMPGWDNVLIEEHAKICADNNTDKIILSQLVSRSGVLCDCYTKKEVCNKKHKVDYFPSILDYSPSLNAIVLMRMSRDEESTNNKNYQLTRASAAGFFFAPGAWVKEVGIINGIEAVAEEPLLSYTSYLRGWDIYGLKNISPVGHDASHYNMALYGKTENIHKTYTRVKDDQSVSFEIQKLFGWNLGKFALENPKRSPDQFWDSLGMLSEIMVFRQKNKERFNI